MFIGIGFFNLFNLLYHFFMVRHLAPVDYGQLNTLMALFMLITVPANTVQTTITKFVSVFEAKSQHRQTRDFLKHFLLVMVTVALFFFLAIALGSSLLSSFLQISSRGVILLTGVILFFAMITPIPWGGLQGLQKFGLLTVNLLLNGGLKLLVGILLVARGWGVLGAMGSIAIAYFVTTLLSLILMGFSMRKEGEEAHPQAPPILDDSSSLSEAYRYFFPVGITLLCFMILTQIDLILVKHFFTPIEAGYYSIAQMVGKIILFLPLPVVMVMFPKVSLMDAQRKKTSPILMQSLIITGSFGILGIIICHFFPSHIIQILTGTVYPECIPLIKLFSINMTFFSLTFILLYYHLAIQRKGFIYPLLSLTLIQVGSIVLFHQTMIQVLLVVSIVGVCLVGVNLFLVYFPREKGMEG
jgi:O-antigen/teichoic acid export membrane protein